MAALENRQSGATGSRWILGAVGIVLVAAIGDVVRAETPTAPADRAALLAKARHLQHDGDIRAAEEIASSELKHDSDQSHVAGSLELLTLIYKQSGRYEDALVAERGYQQLLEKIPNADASKRQDMHLLLAEVLTGLGKYPQAIAHVDDGLKIAGGWRTTDPLWEPHAFALRAQIERAAGEIEAAERDWREVASRMRSVLDQIGRTGPNTDLEESALKLLDRGRSFRPTKPPRPSQRVSNSSPGTMMIRRGHGIGRRSPIAMRCSGRACKKNMPCSEP